ncbi:mitochondrial calcium uniporter regulator 1-like [Elysia marginata]|nr:mitochondrial calcium uniporter regulator 1-like [Elysia marginata]
MTLLQKSEFSSLKTETEKISISLTQSQDHMNDEIVKLKGQFSLDINLERGRAIEAHAENEKRLQQLHNKIDTEIANLKTVYEMYRNDVFKYAGGTVLAVGSIVLAAIRLMH